MAFPVPHFQPQPAAPAPEPPAMVRNATREDVLWNRPVFKAPPLQLHPQAFNSAIFAQDLCRIGLVQR
jgi:hypothetical protein